MLYDINRPERYYVKRLLAPTLKPGQLVVMDNLGAHRPKRVRELIEARGCKLIYLPSYSLDLNSIEEAFRGGQASAEEDRRPRQEVPARGDGPSVGSREHRRRERILRSLWLARPGAATIKTLLGLNPAFLMRRVALAR